ncbi:coat F domain-containing protein [Hydrogenispora ethanolica]|jgi:spore coat protein CotF|uniref:Coat F domain-containing protein n=1 Tax=Hydrogenispora ethanolica TaxID=1082276 RepID=A0A4R1R046_HYDET|nr:spore coat protein [Hydrogenispora ethanolica]TCL58629.1 coat F domain-containing protein [Hydrogenispora ethanolica]
MNQPNQPNPNVIKNPQTGQLPQVKGPEMNERDFLNDMLATEKYLTDNFNILAREASHQSLNGEALRILNETHQAARTLFNLMFEKGWYQLTAASPQEISQTGTQFQNYRSQEPYHS